ncbi:hypothetical protein [Lysinibacter cavernae]|uniref:Uncharacterized protein n=1 Tax=Lysinibacter cavernae TaxID=1640652 RepID=A0A7X5R0V1_9MICO|nr:hypothetical protein [Lysinibacter cavernae]NIH53536.1 hypothetical protein [Lysinibacter cavernae]
MTNFAIGTRRTGSSRARSDLRRHAGFFGIAGGVFLGVLVAVACAAISSVL